MNRFPFYKERVISFFLHKFRYRETLTVTREEKVINTY